MSERHKGFAWGWMMATLTVAVVYILDQFMPPVTSLWKMAFSLCVGGLIAYLRGHLGEFDV